MILIHRIDSYRDGGSILLYGIIFDIDRGIKIAYHSCPEEPLIVIDYSIGSIIKGEWFWHKKHAQIIDDNRLKMDFIKAIEQKINRDTQYLNTIKSSFIENIVI